MTPEKLSSFEKESARRFSTLGAGYTFFVRIGRVALPLLALVLLGIVIARLSDEGPQLADIPQEEKTAAGKIDLLAAKYEGTDAQGRPFTLTADKAERKPDAPDIVLLEKPKGDITLENKTWLAVHAASGLYDTKAQTLALSGGVALYQDNGAEMHFDSVTLDLQKRTAFSDAPVKGQSAFGTLAAQNMRMEDGGDKIVFGGPAILTLHDLGGEKG